MAILNVIEQDGKVTFLHPSEMDIHRMFATAPPAQQSKNGTAALLARVSAIPKQAGRKQDAALLPDRRIQQDFFVADLVDYALKDDQATMEAPMFSLSTKTDRKLFRWKSKDGKKTVEVAPGFYGRATQLDKDVLIYCISQLIAALNKGEKPSRIVRFTAYDFFVATNRSTRGDEYDMLPDRLNRLKGMQITTNIMTGNIHTARGFGLIESWKVIRKSPNNSRMEAVEVTLSDWLFNAINAKEVLTIHRDYFRLRSSLARRLYEIARKHVGHQPQWIIGIEALRDKCGSKTLRLRQFHGAIIKIIKANNLPEYQIALKDGGLVQFYSRDVQQLAKSALKRKSK